MYGRRVPIAEFLRRLQVIDAEEIKRVAWKYLHDRVGRSSWMRSWDFKVDSSAGASCRALRYEFLLWLCCLLAISGGGRQRDGPSSRNASTYRHPTRHLLAKVLTVCKACIDTPTTTNRGLPSSSQCRPLPKGVWQSVSECVIPRHRLFSSVGNTPHFLPILKSSTKVHTTAAALQMAPRRANPYNTRQKPESAVPR